MMENKRTKMRLGRVVFGFLFAIIGIFGLLGNVMLTQEVAYADPIETTTSDTAVENTDTDEKSVGTGGDGCKESLGAIGWLVCPTTGAIAGAVDFLYGMIQDILVINPIAMEDGSPIYEIWKYCLGLANIVFVIFLLVVIYSQITGLGISNYGIKKALPKMIVVAVLVNLSFLICALAVDVSNIIGNSLRGLFDSVEESAAAGMSANGVTVSNADAFGALASGSALGIGSAVIAFETGAIWMMIPTLLGALVAVVTGLVTIALRQAVVALLVMIAPLAIVAYMLPNTESLFKKWRKLLTQMLVFYPMFSLLFGASSLAGFAIIASARDGFWVLLGIAVQIFPLFLAWKLMQMSGTFLGDINTKMRSMAASPVAASRNWADAKRVQTKANRVAHAVTPAAGLMRYLNERRALREQDTKNALEITASRSAEYVQRKIAGVDVTDVDATRRGSRASRYTRNEKLARTHSMMAQTAAEETKHVIGNYKNYYNTSARDKALNALSERAFLDAGRAVYQREIDDENDVSFLVDKYLEANKRDANNRPLDREAFNRYVRSVVGPDGEERLTAKIIAQAAKVESKQKAEAHTLISKYGFNGYNKNEIRSWSSGYKQDGDGWALDINGERLKYDDGTYVELVPGDAITKAPEKLVLYDKRDEQGLYFDFKDQNGNIVSRIHRGTGADGLNHDNPAFIKTVLADFDIPIGDQINNVYGILSGLKPGDVVTPQGPNEIGLSRYSTTIGNAMKSYKDTAAWAGPMFNTGLSNRQIKNSSQYAIWVLDSIKKTLKPGAFNTQNPASVEYIKTIFDPDNWEKIFTEEELISAVNINNEPYGGEEWEIDDDGTINYTPVDNPTYEQRMNTIKRKLIFPAMKKVLPAFDRLRTSNTIDNQKPGTADAQYAFLQMVKEKWENNPEIQFDPTLVDQDLQSEAREFRLRKHDKDGNLIYAPRPEPDPYPMENLLSLMEDAYNNSMLASDLTQKLFEVLNRREEYSRALERFNELCIENPDATMEEIRDWFVDLDCLVRY